MLVSAKEPPAFSADEQICFVSSIEEKNRVLEYLLDSLMKRNYIEEEDLMWTRLVLDEAFVNAIKHGNAYDLDKQVTVDCSWASHGWAMLIADEGKGFSAPDVPSLDDEESLLMNHGRGVNLMKHYMDTVQYYRGGSVLLLEKKRSTK